MFYYINNFFKFVLNVKILNIIIIMTLFIITIKIITDNIFITVDNNTIILIISNSNYVSQLQSDQNCMKSSCYCLHHSEMSLRNNICSALFPKNMLSGAVTLGFSFKIEIHMNRRMCNF
jgi:hypothetical protein